ncbi:DgyrCDS6467 [Dimorphilus gyrociliatus]|uniref:DgyrCDS6467 n=1 Tax=Dimorphilus gyrociliatus TaxID=2664684 RepID=A0A7I8VNA6_9ANNE|nr:DgyrCDS6467 [Dimorphilus gyrociliatus]
MADNSQFDNENDVQTFSEITNVSKEEASRLLEAYGGDLQAALDGFCNMEEDESGEEFRNIASAGNDPPVRIEPVKEPEKIKNPPKPTSRFGSISALRNQEANSSDSGEEEGEAYYAGGSERGTGQQVLGPPKKKDLVKNIFKSAREHGAVEVTDSAPTASGSSAFHGTGYRLGQSETEQSEVVRGRRMKKNMKVILKMYKNGFIVGDDDELRPFTNPENAKFLRDISSGHIPQELINKAEGGEVFLDMEDHREEEYVSKKKTVKAFTGYGQALGGEVSAPEAASSNIGSSVDSVRKPEVDPSKPTTNIQIRLANGSRLIAKLNTSHTVGDLKDFVRSERQEYAEANFVLMTTFPNKVYSEEDKTLEEAGLLGSAMTQRLQ